MKKRSFSREKFHKCIADPFKIQTNLFLPWSFLGPLKVFGLWGSGGGQYPRGCSFGRGNLGIKFFGSIFSKGGGGLIHL